jgi:hypothetical protein
LLLLVSTARFTILKIGFADINTASAAFHLHQRGTRLDKTSLRSPGVPLEVLVEKKLDLFFRR